MVSVNWLLNDEPLSVKDALAIELTDDLLVGTSAATLRKALTDSGLGESVIGGGLSSELMQNTFGIGLKVFFWEVFVLGQRLPQDYTFDVMFRENSQEQGKRGSLVVDFFFSPGVERIRFHD